MILRFRLLSSLKLHIALLHGKKIRRHFLFISVNFNDMAAVLREMSVIHDKLCD
jgi:hypothetical protein